MIETMQLKRQQGREWLSAAKQGDLSLLTTLLAGNQSLLHHQARHCRCLPCSCNINDIIAAHPTASLCRAQALGTVLYIGVQPKVTWSVCSGW